MSKYFIENAFVDPNVPLSDDVRGLYGITPPELLHTTHEGVTKYVTKAISKLLSQGSKKLAGKARELIEKLHHTLHSECGRNSERDFPRSSDRTRLFALTLVQAHERWGNLFILLCISHCRDAKLYFVDALTEVGVNPNDFSLPEAILGHGGMVSQQQPSGRGGDVESYDCRSARTYPEGFRT
ncbi:hypothetical protein ACHAWF_017564 [Thalassiosira exigua]